MSVLIKGMKMPGDCPVCPLAHWNKLDRFTGCELKKRYFDKEDMETRGRPSFCPLVEIPAQHGRLGDLDAMAFDESEAYMSAQAKLGRDVITTGLNSIVHRKIQLLIMDTPTIIEAEVSE